MTSALNEVKMRVEPIGAGAADRLSPAGAPPDERLLACLQLSGRRHDLPVR